MITLLLHVLRLLPFLFGGHRQLAVENLALRQQLAVYKRTTSLMVVIISEFPSSTSGNHLIVRLAHLDYHNHVAHMCMRPSYGVASRALSQFVVSAFRLSGRGVF